MHVEFLAAEQKEQDSVIVIIPKNSLVEDLGIIVSSEAYSTSRVLICGVSEDIFSL